MVCHGKFVSEREGWSSYIEWPENYFVANDVVTAEKKRAILLSVCGARTSQLIRNLTTQVTPLVKSYEDLVKLVQEHYSSRRPEIVQRLKFNSHMHKQEESVSTFIAELRKLSEFVTSGTC